MNRFILSCLITTSLLMSLPVKAEILKVATWNVEWLLTQQDLKKVTIPSNVILRHTKDFQKLLGYTQKLNADIIALQEVGSIETLQEIIPKEQYLFFISNDVIAQHTAIAIRKNPAAYTIERNADVDALSHLEHTHPLRSGLDITLHTKKTSLRLLVVHLKSGCQNYMLDSRKMDCIILKQQLPLLQGWIQERLKEHQAFIILGDFNRDVSTHDNFFKNLSTSPLTIPTAKIATPCWGGGYFIDGFIIDPTASNWIVNDSLRVMTYTEKDNESQKLLSDHCPVSIKIALPE